MNISIFEKKAENAVETIEHGWLGSGRFIVFAAIAGVVIWLAMKGLTDLHFTLPLLGFGCFYMACNTLTKMAQIKENGAILRERQRLAWADGTLTDIEGAALASADANATSVTNVIKP